jgi:hypothetical protein
MLFSRLYHNNTFAASKKTKPHGYNVISIISWCGWMVLVSTSVNFHTVPTEPDSLVYCFIELHRIISVMSAQLINGTDAHS